MSDNQLIGTLPDGDLKSFKSPQIHHAKSLCDKLGASIVIVIAIDEDKGTFGLASYGETISACERGRKAVDQIGDSISKGKIFPEL